MRRAISIPPFADAREIVRLGVAAEAAGWDAVFLWDHVRWSSADPLDISDPWVLLGAIAAGTERVLLGPLVTPPTRRRPWKLAKEVITLDHLSGGRAVLGVGLGAPAGADFADLGEESDPRIRGEMLDESLEILDGLLRGARVDHDGAHYSIHTQLVPAAAQRPRPPIWVAGVAPNAKPLARARRWDGFVPIGYPRLTPTQLVDYIGTDRPPGWDVVVSRAADAGGIAPSEYAAVGVTWLLESINPTYDGWLRDLGTLIREGPPTG